MNFMLDTAGWQNVLKGAVVAAVGAGLTVLVVKVGQFDLGANLPWAVAGFTVVADYFRRVFNVLA